MRTDVFAVPVTPPVPNAEVLQAESLAVQREMLAEMQQLRVDNESLRRQMSALERAVTRPRIRHVYRDAAGNIERIEEE